MNRSTRLIASFLFLVAPCVTAACLDDSQIDAATSLRTQAVTTPIASEGEGEPEAKCACKYGSNDPAATVITDDCPQAEVCEDATCVVDVTRGGLKTRETLVCETISQPTPPPTP